MGSPIWLWRFRLRLSFGGAFFAWWHHGTAIIVTAGIASAMGQNNCRALRAFGAGDLGGAPLLLACAHACS